MTKKFRSIVVAALYKFVTVEDVEATRIGLSEHCETAKVRGILLIAREGLNGTIAGTRQGIDRVVEAIRAMPGCDDLEYKESYADEMPFLRMKVRAKAEIVTMGFDDIDAGAEAGTYVTAKDWNDLMRDPDVVVVDTRNDYEVEIGTFPNALNPETKTFRDFPEWARHHLDKSSQWKIAMFCTGGIRCEKATAYLKAEGFKNVYHLKGGILQYLEDVPADESLWQGECFVFDQRVSVGQGLEPGPYQLCSICREPFLSGEDGGGYADRFCDACVVSCNDETFRRAQDRQKQVELARQRGGAHIGPAHRKREV